LGYNRSYQETLLGFLERGDHSLSTSSYELLLRAVVDDAPGVLWTTDRHLRLLEIHGRAMADPDEPTPWKGEVTQASTAHDLREYFGLPEDESALIDAHRRALNGGLQICDFEWRNRSFRGYVVARVDESNGVIGCLGGARLVGSVEPATSDSLDRGLADSENLLKRLLLTNIAAVFLVDTEGWILFANQRVQKVLGISLSQTPEKPVNVGSVPWMDDAGRRLREQDLPYRRVLESGEVLLEMRCVLQQDNGERTYLSINAAPLTDAAGTITSVVHVIEDLTKRIRAEHDRDRFFDLSLDLLGTASLEGYFRSVNPPLRGPGVHAGRIHGAELSGLGPPG
jgi:PAS domain S-box-containing protein